MRHRLLLSTVSIVVVAVLLLGVPLGVVGGRLIATSAKSRLEREADRAAVRLAAVRDAGRPIDAAAVAAVAAPGHLLLVRRRDGRLIRGGDEPGARSFRVAADGPAGFRSVVVVAPADERTEHRAAVWLAVAVVSVVALAVAIGLALLQARRLSRPLEDLSHRAGGIGHPGYARARSASGVAEVDAVAAALDDADARIADLLRAEREFSANVSHQLRGPLTGLRLRLEELALLAADDAPVDAEVAAALEQADRLMDTIRHLEGVARGREQAGPPVDLGALVAEHVAQLWQPRFAGAGRRLVAQTVPAPVTFPAEAARQVLDVLVDNALAHGAGATTVAVSADGAWCRLAVQDDGPGVADADRERVFARGHSAAGGSGVGLALARDLVRRGGGELRLTGRSRFEAVLPRADRN
jgi:signal transduction histidine kinase